MLIKHIAALILLSLLILLAGSFFTSLLNEVTNIHHWFIKLLSHIFTSQDTARWLRDLLAMLALPALAGLIPCGVYWSLKRKPMPYTLYVIWLVWIIQAVAILLTRSYW
jgi:sulfite exporter TauE/SafE